MNRNKRLERAIEIGVERLRGSLYEKECEIKEKLLELKECELRIKNRESGVEESLRILEQEKKNNEYLRIVNSKTEKIFNSAIKSLKSKEKLLEDGLNSIIGEFGILDNSGDEVEKLDINMKIENIKSYIRKIKRNEDDILKYAKRQQIEKIGNSTSLCKCGFPIFSVNDEIIVAKSQKGNESELVELEFRYMELEWERKAIEHTKNTLRQEKLRQEEIMQSKEERLKHKNSELENRLREVKRMEHILKKNISTLNNSKLKRNSLPNNLEKYTSDAEDNYISTMRSKKYDNNNNVDNTSGITPEKKGTSTEKCRNLNGESFGTRVNSNDENLFSSNRNYTESISELTPEKNKHKINITYPNSKKLSLTTRMSPLLKSQRQRLRHILYEEELCSEDASHGLKPNIGADSLNGDNSSSRVDSPSRVDLTNEVNVLNGINALKITIDDEKINDEILSPIL
ncbi:spectrin repeat protein [Cryptosporidium bovis]|uniref:spectrin repeat protein n=1 Tax=Cryptosporidium bovis TaxID=310047 RepID=UPI003519ED79|nr:spectrin repeat protein [Cryptosporidium bovis]